MASLRHDSVFLTHHDGNITCVVAGDLLGPVAATGDRTLRFGSVVVELSVEEYEALVRPEAPVVEPSAEVVEAPVAEPVAEPVTEPVAEEAAAPATTSRRGRRKA